MAPELAHLRRENQALVAQNFELERDLATQTNLVELLRQQLKHFSDAKPEEPTAPGIGPLPPPLPAEPHPTALLPAVRGRWSRRHWALAVSLGLALAAAGATARYPQLMAPIRYLQEHVQEIADLLGVLL